MKFFFWQKNAIIDEFAHQIANELFSQIQPEDAEQYFCTAKATPASNKENIKHQKRQERITKVINNTIVMIQQFRAARKLGIYGKARLHLTFTERLKELGYPAQVAESVNKTLLLHTP